MQFFVILVFFVVRNGSFEVPAIGFNGNAKTQVSFAALRENEVYFASPSRLSDNNVLNY
jgi:hypothetical protein